MIKLKIAKLLYSFCRREIENLFVEEILGKSPDTVTEPIVKLIDDNKRILNKWLTWQAWNMQKGISIEESAEKRRGVLIHIRAMLSLCNENNEMRIVPPAEVKDTPDPTIGVKEFLKMRKVDENKSVL